MEGLCKQSKVLKSPALNCYRLDSICCRCEGRLFYRILPEYFRLVLNKSILSMGVLSLRQPLIISVENSVERLGDILSLSI